MVRGPLYTWHPFLLYAQLTDIANDLSHLCKVYRLSTPEYRQPIAYPYSPQLSAYNIQELIQ